MSNTPPRLLFVLNDAPFFITHRLPLALAARDAGFEVHVAVPFEAGPVSIMKAENLRHHDIPLRRGARAILGEVSLIAAIWRVVRRVKPDLMHAVTIKPVVYGGFVARLARVPAVVHAVTGLGYLFLIDGTSARAQRRFVMRLYKFALAHRNAHVIFQNPDDLKLFLEARLVDPNIVSMIKGCGVDVAAYAGSPEPEGEPAVMFPARILGDKGVHEFVEAARILKPKHPKARFVLVGRTDPDNPTDVGEVTIRKWEGEGIVEWWGFSTDMAETLAKAHIVCMPSYREGLPRVLIEAAATGRPIVTADVPGCREIVRDGDNGILVPVRDGPATASAIEKLLNDPDLRTRMGARGQEIAEAEFSVGDFVAKSLAAYAEVLPRASWAETAPA